MHYTDKAKSWKDRGLSSLFLEKYFVFNFSIPFHMPILKLLIDLK